ncbi:MAG: tRNA (adenosine(37)-N6)-dimethylallyltransferase MiaA [Bacilli bacterium]|nr:tRNA (adenosine(37)-N6)-dimethylallyltransferase MiaA [Bacilli bacterium]
MSKIIVIVGPTGVGKTKLSIELAKKLDAEIINGDSVAIYKELNIGSAKPTKEELSEATHHLVNIRSVEEDFSVYDYQLVGREILDKLISENKNIIIVGGTGLYIKALLYDYRFSEEKNDYNFDDLSNVEIYNKIKEYDSNIDIHINNRKRLIRVLTRFLNGEEITHNKDKLLYDSIFIGLTSDREVIYKRINDRVDSMIHNGLIDEVINLKDKYTSSRILNTAIGYKEFASYFDGSDTKEEVISKIKRDSRRFAKRQYTFFNHQFDVNWFDVNFVDFDVTIKEIEDFINKKKK